jgi:hypothetical protein
MSRNVQSCSTRAHPRAGGEYGEDSDDVLRLKGSSPRWREHVARPPGLYPPAATAMRQQRLEMLRPPTDPQVETRRLADYDELLGVSNAADGAVEGGVS